MELMLEKTDVFLLVLVRMTGLFVIAPVFGRRNIPASLKTGFALFSTLIVLNTFSFENLVYSGYIQLALLVLIEFVIGTTLGFIAYMMISAIYVAGQLIDMQIGFGMVNVIDPMSNIQVPITANFYYITSILVFLMTGGHLLVIKALYQSYSFIPIGGAVFNNNVLDDIVRLFGNVFIIGFRIAAPVTAVILMANVALGIMARAVPQLNVFVLGMPLKIMMGIAVMLITIPVYITLLQEIFGGMEGEMHRFLESLSP